MTVKQRLSRSNIIMILVPVLVTVVLGLGGAGVFLYILDTRYLPKIGLSLEILHRQSERFEGLFSTFEMYLWIYVGVFIFAVILSIILTNLYLTRFVFSHVSEPLDTLVAGVRRIQNGDLESPICYSDPDEFRPACDAVDLMAARLKESMDRSQQEQQSRKELFAGMSHDLRSPLTSIRAYTEALKEGVAATPQARQKYLDTIYAKEIEIEAMVERLFQFSKMDMGEYPVHLEPLDIRKATQSAMAAAGRETLSVSMDDLAPEIALADREQYERIVLNVLDNSRKYRSGDTAHVDISSRREADRVIVTFADDGPGVDEDKLPRLFDVFFRVDPARKNPSGGSGLGLAIVKKAAEQMHGSVSAEKSALGGLAIVLCLPWAGEERK